MDTGLLRGFAVGARVDLLKEVGARLDVVLASGSVARAEAPGSVAALERAVGKDGREAVVDRVAYTWFNRIIALRFMDANGHTGVGVVSPEPGKLSGQPQVLSDAKGGDFDSDVVSGKTQATVIALLNGTRPSADPQGEAYGLLLEAYCRFWNKAMPFMFEREGDYTELLMPTALLATDSVRDRAVRTLTDEVCGEVEVIGWLYQFYISERKGEVFAGFKKNKKAGAAEIPAATQLFTPHWIVQYLVENSLGRLWLLNHRDSQLAEQMDYYIPPVDEETDFLRVSSPEELKIIDPAVGSGHMLTYAFDLLYAIYEEQAYSPSEIPSKILEHNLYGAEIDPRAGALAAFALTMKAAAKRKLFLKNPVQPHICVLENVRFEQADLDYLWSLTSGAVARSDADGFWNAFEHADTFGSLIQPNEALIPLLRSVVEELEATGNLLATPARRVLDQAGQLSTRYSVAVANPPYMGAGSMNAKLATRAAKEYPNTKADLFAMFIERCWSIVQTRGLVGMITMQSWMFLPTFRAMRDHYTDQSGMVSLLHLGSGAFDTIGGEVVSTVAWVWAPGGAADADARFIDLTETNGEAEMARAARQHAATGNSHREHIHSLDDFTAVPGNVLAYQLSDVQVAAFKRGPSLRDVIELREGINTGENDRFLRRWWEVSRDRSSIGLDRPTAERSWLPYKKGGTFRKWAGNEEYVVDWKNDGAAIRNSPRARPQNTQYFYRESVSWTRIAGNNFSMRYYGQGFGFDSTGPSGFGTSTALRFSLAFLNSRIASPFLRALSPTLDFRLGNLGSLPVPPGYEEVDLTHIDRLIGLATEDWDEQELSWGFARCPLVADARLASGWMALRGRWADRVREVSDLELRNEVAVASAYALEAPDRAGEASVSLFADPSFRYPTVGKANQERLFRLDAVRDLVSYAVGCMFGRYSLDVSGLVLANQGDTLQEYLSKVPNPSFIPDADGVVPIVDGEWFEDDIVAKFRQFLRVAFGEEHFEENLKFVIDSLGVKDLRDYFVKSFFKDHVQRYKKRPIYWMFSSPKGSFNALVYLHRYNPSTVSTVLNEYLREFIKKLEVSLEQQERLVVSGTTAREVAASQKEAERLRKVLIELGDYERDLYELASHQIDLDLDDGVLVNYQKFGTALKDIGLKKGGENA